MGKVLVVCCLLLASGAAFAQTQPAADTSAQPASEASGGATWPWVAAGVVGGVVVVDLLTGGALTGPLFGATRAAAAPMFTPAMAQEMTSAGALIGERIAPATARRDEESRAEILRLLALAAGGLAGGLGVNALVGP